MLAERGGHRLSEEKKSFGHGESSSYVSVVGKLMSYFGPSMCDWLIGSLMRPVEPINYADPF